VEDRIFDGEENVRDVLSYRRLGDDAPVVVGAHEVGLGLGLLNGGVDEGHGLSVGDGDGGESGEGIHYVSKVAAKCDEGSKESGFALLTGTHRFARYLCNTT
jgi:hypothetical protein